MGNGRARENPLPKYSGCRQVLRVERVGKRLRIGVPNGFRHVSDRNFWVREKEHRELEPVPARKLSPTRESEVEDRRKAAQVDAHRAT